MGAEQDRGWNVKTERHYVSLRGSSASFYESQATHPIYGETIPARSIDEQTAYQETLARIGRIEDQMSSAAPMMEMGELEAETEVGAMVRNPDAASPSVPVHNEQESVQTRDPLAAEFGYTARHLNLTRRVDSGLANHRQTPRRRPSGRTT